MVKRHFLNKASVDLFSALSALGGAPLLERASCDDQSAGCFQADFRRWVPALWAALGAGGRPCAATCAAAITHRGCTCTDRTIEQMG
jgi:hypothetical protein